MKPFDLKILRLRAGLTQHEVGLKLGLPSYEISRIETGRVEAPPEVLSLLLKILHADTGCQESP